MPSIKKLTKLYARLGHLRATRDSATGGRKSVYASEIKSVVSQINAEKAKPGKPH